MGGPEGKVGGAHAGVYSLRCLGPAQSLCTDGLYYVRKIGRGLMSPEEAAAWLVFEKEHGEGSCPGSFQGQAEWGGAESWAPQDGPAQVGSDTAGCPALAQGSCPLLRPGPCSPTTICGTTLCLDWKQKVNRTQFPL